MMEKIRVSHLHSRRYEPTSGIASYAPAPNTTPPGLAKAIFSSTYTRHQCTAMILIQRRVKGDASFQGVRGRTAYDLSEFKKEPPQEHDSNAGDKGQ